MLHYMCFQGCKDSWPLIFPFFFAALMVYYTENNCTVTLLRCESHYISIDAGFLKAASTSDSLQHIKPEEMFQYNLSAS